MTNPPTLPPLPATNFVDENGLWDERYGPYDADQMRAYVTEAVRTAMEAKTVREDEVIALIPSFSQNAAWLDIKFAKAVLALVGVAVISPAPTAPETSR